MSKNPFGSFFLAIALLFLIISCGAADSEKEKEKEVVQSLRIMSYNIHHANPPSKPEIIDIDAIVKTIAAQDPDFVALQEVDVNTERSGEGNQAEIIAERLGMYYHFGKALDYGGGEYGTAILSKYPLEDETVHRLPNAPGDNTEQRVLTLAKTNIPGGPEIIFGSTHLDYKATSPSRIIQLQEIVKISQEAESPIILGGDFNAKEGSETIDLLKSTFTLTCTNCPPTIPVINPNRAIDFIVFNHPEQNFETRSHKVINETYASDHLPIVAVIDLLQ